MKQTFFLLVLAMVMCSLNVCAQTKKPARKTTVSVPKDSKEYQIEKDGFEWYKVCKNGKFGAENRNGTLLIPLEYDYIRHIGGGFEVRKNNYVGIFNIDGKCVIPINRHYIQLTSICSNSSVGKYYTLESLKDGPTIFCNGEGDEICQIEGYLLVSPKNEKGKFFYEAVIESQDENNTLILDGNGCQVFGPAYSIDIRGDGTVYEFTKQKEFKKIGHLSAISTTDNPFAKKKRRGITYVSDNNSNTQSDGGNNNNSGNGKTTVVVEHHRDPVPVQQWQACFACGGMGTMGCDNCGGSGTKYIGDRLHRCSRCNGRGIIPCNICYGNKGQYVTVYK